MLESTKKEKPSPDAVHSFILSSGEWRSLFDELRCKMLVAEALNATIREHEFRGVLVGYHIRDWSVYLVLVTDHKKVRNLLHRFYDHVRDGIRNQLDQKKKDALKEILGEERITRHDLFEHLFSELPLRDEQYTRLITGRKVVLPYYDPVLARLKDSIHNDPFCSALDYRGGKSPVLVRVMSKREWTKMETPPAHPDREQKNE